MEAQQMSLSQKSSQALNDKNKWKKQNKKLLNSLNTKDQNKSLIITLRITKS